MRESHEIYETQGVAAYASYQREHEEDILQPGEAFPAGDQTVAYQ